MFSITQNKGFQITFANGNTVSVQWGAGNYCGNYGAEIAVWRADGEWITKDAPMWDEPEYANDVFGFATLDQVAQVIAWASK